jgi:hypothetical protein
MPRVATVGTVLVTTLVLGILPGGKFVWHRCKGQESGIMESRDCCEYSKGKGKGDRQGRARGDAHGAVTRVGGS